MSNVVIVAVGSRGDVAPLTGVGVRLKQAGHDVAIAAYTPFADMITHCGLGFRDLPAEPDPAAASEVNPMKGLAQFAAPAGMRALGEAVLAAVGDEPADILLLSPFSELVGHPLAEAKGIPSIGTRLQPLSPTKDYPPTVLGAGSAGATGNRLAGAAGGWLIDRLSVASWPGFDATWACPRSPPEPCADGEPRRIGLYCMAIHRSSHHVPAAGDPAWRSPVTGGPPPGRTGRPPLCWPTSSTQAPPRYSWGSAA